MVESRWWRNLFSHSHDHELVLPEVEDAAEEGEAITIQAALLALKNRMLVSALRHDEPFVPANFYDGAREEVQALVAETRQQSAQLQQSISRAFRLKGDARYHSDYRRQDTPNLEHRRDVLELIADRLSEHASDEEWIDELVHRAHQMAWAEISREMELSLRRKDRMIFGDENYEVEREQRLAEFKQLDLADVIAQETNLAAEGEASEA